MQGPLHCRSWKRFSLLCSTKPYNWEMSAVAWFDFTLILILQFTTLFKNVPAPQRLGFELWQYKSDDISRLKLSVNRCANKCHRQPPVSPAHWWMFICSINALQEVIWLLLSIAITACSPLKKKKEECTNNALSGWNQWSEMQRWYRAAASWQTLLSQVTKKK